jgi:hypothetical protein
MGHTDRHSTPRQTANWCVIVACLQSLVNVYQRAGYKWKEMGSL